MKKLDEATQLLAVEKILEEMKQTEKNLLKWNAYWYERYDNIVVPPEYLKSPYDSQDNAEHEKYFGVKWYSAADEPQGIPIKTMKLDNGCNYGICTINWNGIKTCNARRNICFSNTGDIILAKTHSKWSRKHYSKVIEYESGFNVLSDDFDFFISVLTLNTKGIVVSRDDLSIILAGNILTKRYNDIEIIDNLTSGTKQIKIFKKYDRERSNNASVLFEATLDNTNVLEKEVVEINTHKGNGKINGTYRISASKRQMVSANFYSRKGVKINLATNSLLFSTPNRLMLTGDKDSINDNMIITNFAIATDFALSHGLADKLISFDSSEMNMEMVAMAENKVIEMIKTIRGEIPIDGLVSRIDSCLETIKASRKPHHNVNSKVLRLVSANKNNQTIN